MIFICSFGGHHRGRRSRRWRRGKSNDRTAMTSNQQPGRKKEIFDHELEISSAEQRQGYIKGACGSDAELLARVQDLLRAHAEATGFLREDGPGQTSGWSHCDGHPTGELSFVELAALLH